MANIDKAQKARKENILARPTIFNNRICTQAQFIEFVLNDGGHAEAVQVPSVRYNRVKYNRMNEREQKEFDKKYAIKKNEYRLYKNDDSFYTLNKTEYNYAKSIEEN